MKQILTIAHYEVVHIFKDRILFLMVFLVPLLYALLFGMIYVSGTLQQVPLGIVDLSHSEESRSVVEVFENTPNFHVISAVQAYADLEAGMRNGTVRAGIVIPENYAQKLAQHQLTQILTVYDGSNLIYGYNTRKYLQQELNTFSVNHTAAYLSGLGMTKHEITNIMDTVSFRLQVWNNPTFSYATFIFIGLVIMILHQIGLLGIGLTVTREKERNSWIQFLCTDIPSWKIFLGKILPYFVINAFNYGLLLWIAAKFIDVKIEGSLSVILLLGFLFNVILVSLGFVISLYAPNSLQVTRYLMLLSVPLFVLSGYTWPSTHIPKFLNAFAQIIPYTWMANGIRQATVKGLGLADLRITVMVLTIMAAAITFFALTFTKRRNPPAQSGLSVNNSATYPMKAR